MNQKIVYPGQGDTLVDETGKVLLPPQGWGFLSSGDGGITRKVTARGEFWRVQVKRGKRWISRGVWAPKETIKKAREEMAATRVSESYRKKQEQNRRYREKKEKNYKTEFYNAVIVFLNFHERFNTEAAKLAGAVTRHATPVSSGTVARTSRLPLGEKASRGVIAWMRHKTTAYDSIKIPRIKGKRREVRRALAQKSTELLQNYRKGLEPAPDCPLRKALKNIKPF